MTNVIIYTKNACPNCEQVKWALNAAGVTYEIRNIDEDPSYAVWMADKGYMSAPVTVFPSGKELVGFDMGESSLYEILYRKLLASLAKGRRRVYPTTC